MVKVYAESPINRDADLPWVVIDLRQSPNMERCHHTTLHSPYRSDSTYLEGPRPTRFKSDLGGFSEPSGQVNRAINLDSLLPLGWSRT